MTVYNLNSVTSVYLTEFNLLKGYLESLQDDDGTQLINYVIDASIKVNKPHGDQLKQGVMYIESSDSTNENRGASSLTLEAYLVYMTNDEDFNIEFQKIIELVKEKLLYTEAPRYNLDQFEIERNGSLPDKAFGQANTAGTATHVAKFTINVTLLSVNI
ncbi:MAG: hypothetical protein ACRBG0_27755 [Lewinella sp.]|uniref:hypothetical protein n=1 Tax=Lewinella sp. TaxID=2004506 RepID=UPI003D6B3B08